MNNLVLIFLMPLISCQAFRLKDEPVEPVEPVEPTEEPEPTPESNWYTQGLKYVPVGCFRDKYRLRAMPELLKNFRGTIVWSDLSKTVQKCADEAKKRRQQYFGLQYYGECWGGEEADLTYDEYGSNPAGCFKNMVGKAWHNFVYKFNIPE